MDRGRPEWGVSGEGKTPLLHLTSSSIFSEALCLWCCGSFTSDETDYVEMDRVQARFDLVPTSPKIDLVVCSTRI